MSQPDCKYLQQSPGRRGNRSGAGSDLLRPCRSWCRTGRSYSAVERDTDTNKQINKQREVHRPLKIQVCTKKRRSRRAFRNDSECIITTAGCVETAQSSLLRAEPELRPHICVQPVKRLETIRYSQMVSTKQISDQIFKSWRHSYQH